MNEIIDNLKREDYSSDSDWIQAAIDQNPLGEITVPSGHYKIDKPIYIGNACSVTLARSAILTAVKKMDYMITIQWKVEKLPNGRSVQDKYVYPEESKELGYPLYDMHRFFKGGTLNGNGLASCMLIDYLRYFTLSETSFLNGYPAGLHVNRGCETVASNCYFQTTMRGLAGNTALLIRGGDSHYTDIIVVDYTIGFDLGGEATGANRLTRCHVWGGIIPPRAEGEDCEMLKDSIGFLCGSGDNLLRDCYADTAKTGYLIRDWTRLLGCAYVNNPVFKLDHTVVINHENDSPLTVTDGHFTKTSPDSVLFVGNKKNVIWANNRKCTWIDTEFSDPELED